MAKYDVVIIGSGLGGLLCGYILVKNGFKVLILEKNRQIGGCLQTFNSGGVKFDTGMHYIGSMDPGQVMHRFFRYFSLLEDVKLQKLDEDGYDVISYKDSIYKYAMGFGNFVDVLSESFPAERQHLKTYVDRIQEIALESPLYNLMEIEQNVFLKIESVKSSINEFIDSITKNTTLRNVLVGNLPLYAGKKDITPLYIHTLINNFYIQSAYRIVGDCIASSLSTSIRKSGGEIMTQSEVVKFNCDSEKMTSVLLKNGEIIEGKRFISNIHPQATIDKIDTSLIRNATRVRISNLTNSISNFTVYITFRKNRVKYMNSNFYYYAGNDVWECENYTSENWPLNYLYMHQAPVDDNASGYASSAVLIGYMRYDEVEQWESTKVNRRGVEYLEFKQRKAEKLLSSLEKSFPGIMSEIESYSTSSPLTYRDYTATKEGSMYGVLRDKNFPTQTLVSQRTKIPNLYMTGQNINSHGILGVTIGAIVTCSEFMGINTIINDIKNC